MTILRSEPIISLTPIVRGCEGGVGRNTPTVLPDEALEHADAVVVESGEYLPRLLSDAASGQMQTLYRPRK